MTTSLLIINCLECNCRLIDYWLFEHITREWWGYCSCIYPSFVYVSLKGIGVVGLDMYTWGIKDFHKCWSGSLAKRRLCLGPTSVINCIPLSALSLWVSLFPRTPSYNTSTRETKHHIQRVGELKFITPAGPEELTLQALSPKQRDYKIFIDRL